MVHRSLDVVEVWRAEQAGEAATEGATVGAKLQQSGAAAIVVAPRWEGKAWHYALTEIAVEELAVAPRPGLFRPGRREGRDPGTMVRYVTWLGNSETIKAPNMQPYLSAVNNFF
eukprot:jgi/Tetstr1/460056/TSEL_005376.t1